MTKMTILTRRAFQRTFMSALGIGAIGFSQYGSANALSMVEQFGTEPYQYRLRYFRKGRNFHFWIRVSDPANPDQAVPFTFVLSKDVTGSETIKEFPYISHPNLSHASRFFYAFEKKLVGSNTPVYCRLIMGEDFVPGDMWTLLI
jgi:hypothetical protein